MQVGHTCFFSASSYLDSDALFNLFKKILQIILSFGIYNVRLEIYKGQALLFKVVGKEPLNLIL